MNIYFAMHCALLNRMWPSVSVTIDTAVLILYIASAYAFSDLVSSILLPGTGKPKQEL